MEIIKSRCETYILDKAAGLGAEITVCVTLTDAAYPVPKKVTVTGQVAPYAKARLQKILGDNHRRNCRFRSDSTTILLETNLANIKA